MEVCGHGNGSETWQDGKIQIGVQTFYQEGKKQDKGNEKARHEMIKTEARLPSPGQSPKTVQFDLR